MAKFSRIEKDIYIKATVRSRFKYFRDKDGYNFFLGRGTVLELYEESALVWFYNTRKLKTISLKHLVTII